MKSEISEMIRFANLQIKEQKVVVDELSNLKKNRVSRARVHPKLFFT